MVFDSVKMEDLKVYGLNTLCVIILRLGDCTPELSALLLMATIIYTVVRTFNEVKKFKEKGNNHNESD